MCLKFEKEANNEEKAYIKSKKSGFYSKLGMFFQTHFKFSVTNITLSGILMAFYLIFVFLFRLTILRFIPLELEYIFFIFFGIILGPFKGALLSFLADTLSLLLTGKIGT
ncbi:UNVERIFIED_CONTAM: ECF transporter S component [Campylobacter lari]